MTFPLRISSRVWWLAPLSGLAWIVWINAARIERTLQVSAAPEWSVEAAVIDPHSPTGYTDGRRQLIVAGHHHESHAWIVQTQAMLDLGDWRVRSVDYDNAPFGRTTHLATPYRWWLIAMAWGDHVVSGRPLALSIERAALFADPVLHVLLLLAVAGYAARHFGPVAAALGSAIVALSFPLAGNFLGGAPDQQGLLLGLMAAGLLPLVAGLRRLAADTGTETQRRVRRAFFFAGVAGGCALWLDAGRQLPVLGGIALGAALASGSNRRTAGSSAAQAVPPWTAWAAGGCLTSLVGYLIEYFPADLHFVSHVNHPLYALAWLGGGALLEEGVRWIQGVPRQNSRVKTGATVLFGILALAAVPAALAFNPLDGAAAGDPLGGRLTSLNGGVVAANLTAWIARDGVTGAVVATLWPLLALMPALWIVIGRKTGDAPQRPVLAFAIGPVVSTALLAAWQLREWAVVDVAALALVGALCVRPKGNAPTKWAGAAAAAFAAGWCLFAIGQYRPRPPAGARVTLSEIEVQSVIERDLAQWLARRTGSRDGVVLAAPDLASSLHFHAGLRGVASLSRENPDGLSAAVRIAGATSPEEALALIQRRGITHVILPSWDPLLDELGRRGAPVYQNSFIAALHRWSPPPWIRPVPYRLPHIDGVETPSVVVYEVVAEQTEAAAAARLAEYFLESGRLDLATALSARLRRYPADLGALVALAQVESARGDAAAFGAIMKTLLPYLSGGADRSLPWDRRVSLAIVLAQAKQVERAQEQIRRCVKEIDEAKVRSLAMGQLLRLLRLIKAAGTEIADPQVRATAVGLIPPELRKNLPGT